jgi:acylphosphatase
MGQKRVALRVRGRVQGVGFRFFTQHLARAMGITGWVRNEYDGSVEIEAQGDEATLESFTEKVRSGPSFGNVSGLQSHSLPVKDGESSFGIRY